VRVLGAECTGKSQLAQALVDRLQQAGGASVVLVDEWLRTWCEQQGRTPRREEQAGIAQEQQRRIQAAAAGHGIVICDTTPLMTALYSEHYFADSSLLAWALERQRAHRLNLLLAADIPWQPDGLQRDGQAVRAAVDARLRAVLAQHALPFVEVRGHGEQRVQAAWSALRASGVGDAQFSAPEPGA
jgi:nicotinamide riboside kinase